MALMKTSKLILIPLMILLIACGGGESEYYPKPRGTMHMDFPERNFVVYEGNCPYSFEIPDYFEVIADTSNCNANIEIDRFNATVYLTYIPLDTTNLAAHIEKSRKFVYDHSVKADAIEEVLFQDPDRNTFGLKYNIVGDAASLYQFYLTDSIHNFLRGALYFNTQPNYDSLQPSLDYITEDVDRLIETLRWKN